MEINDLIACARREVAMRERVYPQLMARGRMTQAKANHELEAMKNIVSVLLFVAPMLRGMADQIVASEKGGKA